MMRYHSDVGNSDVGELLKRKGASPPVTRRELQNTGRLATDLSHELPASELRQDATTENDSDSFSLGVTAEHPFWSIDRQAFVAASELRLHERTLSIDDQPYRLTSITPRAGPEPVYNIEVANYHVGPRVLVHNMCTSGGKKPLKSTTPAKATRETGSATGQRSSKPHGIQTKRRR